VIRREAVQAGLLPGEVLDQNRIEIDRRRLVALGYRGTTRKRARIQRLLNKLRPEVENVIEGSRWTLAGPVSVPRLCLRGMALGLVPISRDLVY
jgi:hypothetical protein